MMGDEIKPVKPRTATVSREGVSARPEARDEGWLVVKHFEAMFSDRT